ncbi:ATP-binding protein [Acidaminococcus sp. NSJ-142]|jgi:MinD superfamily P-loop ATPase|uniref:ATP-binding protein n=1 Tax=Acidaminococcus hominis TaxID=2897706 RepID=UPI001E52B1D1|nr:ATP-binding protein [Acidaminococcus hominis]MCD2435435.1 ATP-binding protein [Acidaminococcus hominis]
MKQLLILSGKGGTGKTTVAGAFIFLSKAKACADCDVDAPNLHLISHPSRPPERADYFGMPKARIDSDKCIGCGDCLSHCRFDAIEAGTSFRVKPFACEGCGVCAAVCPAGAISMGPAVAGELSLYREDSRVFSTAKLVMGSGTSGKLVTEVKKRMASAAENAELAVIDGSPGIGCPVIASISGVDMVLIVAEPSLSGISDMERIVKTAETFRTKTAVCVNKADVNPAKTEEIRTFCGENRIPFAGVIPFDPEAVKAVNSGKSIAEADCPSGQAVRSVYGKVMNLLSGGETI